MDGLPVDAQVDFFYISAEGEKPYAQEIKEIVARHDRVRAHLVDTSIEGRLTADRVLATSGARTQGLSVFLCGPEGMLRSLQTQLATAGVPTHHIHREYFDWR